MRGAASLTQERADPTTVWLLIPVDEENTYLANSHWYLNNFNAEKSYLQSLVFLDKFLNMDIVIGRWFPRHEPCY